MKTLKKIAILSAAAVILGSCSLDEVPYGFYSTDNFYKTEADAESGLMYAYNALNYLEYLRAIWYIGDIPTETMYAKSDEPGDIHLLDNWTFNANTELTWYYFKYCYIGLNRANTVIARMADCKGLTEAAKARIMGEALFLRAWNYFNLVRTFGIVPLTLDPIVTLDQTTPQLAQSTELIWNQIFTDLKNADELLEENKVFGRVDKVAAEALLAKAYLTVASGKDYNAPGYKMLSYDPDEYYGLAAEYARKVVNDYSSYGFDPDLRHIYNVDAPDGPEHIFIMATDRSGTHEGMYTKIPLQFLPNNSSVPIYIKYGDGTLQKANGNGWGVFIVEDNFVNSFLTADKRRTELIHRQFYNQSGGTITIPSGPKYYSAKYVDPDFIGERTSARPYLIRFSDIMLVLAEAAGPDEGYAIVNQIRSRAGIPNLAPGLSKADFRKEVIKERALELAFEGNRLFDLRRTGTVTSTVTEAQKMSEQDAAFYPIPQREIDLNPNVTDENNNF